jgi:DNA-binding NarL/FixJ family response regulator
MPSRREQLVKFLEGWASEKRLRIVVSDVAAIVALRQVPDCTLAILDGKVERGPAERSNGDAPRRQSPLDKDMFGRSHARTGDLTPRQMQVMFCLRSGQSNKQIARQLELSEATVKVHVRQVMKRLGASNRTQAAVLAMDLALTEIEAPKRVGPLSPTRRRARPSLASSRL